ncbi:protein DpdG [Kitasatospora sp. NPDC056184]|uniref:protein DpdG n=1 Tax=Kitasatospora sp. NPDC056184 TaxID=3345738 RepID=UPI0035D7A8B4
MAYLNPTQTARPDFIWPVFRFLAYQQAAVSQRKVLAFTAPESLGGGGSDTTMSLRTLRELGFLETEGQGDDALWSLGPRGRNVGVDDYDAFQRNLRSALFATSESGGWAMADGVAEDLTRALCWFLTSDPHTRTWSSVQNDKSVPAGVFGNDTRWPSFQIWGAAAGLVAPAPHASNASIADCGTAVRQSVEDLLEPGEEKEALEVLRDLRRVLPVLPGGVLSAHFGFVHVNELDAGPALSFALRRGEIEGWLKLELRSDAPTQIKLFNPDSDFSLLCSSVKRLEADRG